MSKLIYRTKPPREGYVFNQAFLTHEKIGYSDSLPSRDIQEEAMCLVREKLRELTSDLEELGYDPTRVRFQIHFKS